MAPRTVQLFVNSTAGTWSRRKADALAASFRAAGAAVIVSESTSGQVTLADQADHVCVAGGDGTLRHVAGAVTRSGRRLEMSVYPLGTVNLVARECGYPADPRLFVERVLHRAAPRFHHIAQAGDIPICGCASVGPDSFAVDDVSPRIKRMIGKAAYVVAFFRLLTAWPRPRLQVKAAGQDVACEAVYIAKGIHYAGPWSFAPEAALDSPLLHVVALKRANRMDFLRFLWAIWRGSPLAANPNLVRFACTALSVESKTGLSLPLQADGDIIARLPVAIEIDPIAQPFA